MALRWRKRITILPGIHLNLSKSGVSTSIGVPGATLNVGRKGSSFTAGIPGTGLSSRTQLTGGSVRRTSSAPAPVVAPPPPSPAVPIAAPAPGNFWSETTLRRLVMALPVAMVGAFVAARSQTLLVYQFFLLGGAALAAVAGWGFAARRGRTTGGKVFQAFAAGAAFLFAAMLILVGLYNAGFIPGQAT